MTIRGCPFLPRIARRSGRSGRGAVLGCARSRLRAQTQPTPGETTASAARKPRCVCSVSAHSRLLLRERESSLRDVGNVREALTGTCCGIKNEILQAGRQGREHDWIPVLHTHRILNSCKAQPCSGAASSSPMAATSGEGTAGTRLLPAGTALALLGGLVYLGTLCAACNRRGRKKVAPDGVKLVDEALLCQTQLRSLSKSDTKLHELYRVKVRDDVQRPASLNLPGPTAPGGESLHSSGLLHRELPQIPVPEPPDTSPAPDQTYSNLLFTPLRKPVPDAVYECLAVGGEGTPVPPMPAGTQVSPPRAVHGAADYACVHKVKKAVSVEVQDGAVAGPPGAQHCGDGAGGAPKAKLEEMYSTVCKATKKKSQVSASTPRAVKEAGSGWPPPCQQEGAPAAPGPPDPCYESINDRAWTAQARGPDPDYEAVDINWKKATKRDKPGKPRVPENLYESVADVWAGGSQKGSARTAANGLEVYITNL